MGDINSASLSYLDVVFDGVINLAEDKFSGQKLIVFPTFLHQIALNYKQCTTLIELVFWCAGSIQLNVERQMCTVQCSHS